MFHATSNNQDMARKGGLHARKKRTNKCFESVKETTLQHYYLLIYLFCKRTHLS